MESQVMMDAKMSWDDQSEYDQLTLDLFKDTEAELEAFMRSP